MKSRSVIGSSLRTQIIVPMLMSAALAGIAIALAAGYMLTDLTNKWVAATSRSSTDIYAQRVVQSGEQLQHEAAISVHDVRLLLAENPNDETALRRAIAGMSAALSSDMVVLLDESGAVIAVSGPQNLIYGSRPLGDSGAWNDGRPRSLITELDGSHIVAALQPVSVTSRYTLLLAHRIDDEFLRKVGVRTGFAVSLYDAQLHPIASKVGGAEGPHATKISQALAEPSDDVSKALSVATVSGKSLARTRIDGRNYDLSVRRVVLGDGSAARTTAYMAGVVSEEITSATARTMRSLVFVWAGITLGVIGVMGSFISRRVTTPLEELSEGARRIADGDFSTKVSVQGVRSEITELGESFNTMTDSLRERSESLTKKVLELATLYEMSRSLGSTLDMDELLGSVLDSALRIFDLDLGYVVLRDKETGALWIRALRSGPTTGSLDDAVRASMSEWVVREGRPLIFNPDVNSNAAEVDAVTGAKAALCVPLVSGEGTIGSITIGSTDKDYRFDSDDVRLLSTIANHVTIAVGNIELFSSLQDAYMATVRSLAAAVDAKDSYTRGHSDHVAGYATMIAERMGLSNDQVVALEMAAYLHDIGKIGVPEDILLKPGKLDDTEMERMRHHPLIGANILKPVAFPWAINPVVRHHHEAYDGSGYPAGLRGDEIPLLARILTVADSFEAMTADRPYRRGMTVERALEELAACSGSQFDPRVAEIFAQIVAEMEEAGEIIEAGEGDEVSPDEVRAIFSALVDGVFSSFRKLGGPRLANNVEAAADAYFDEGDLPFRIRSGRLAYTRGVPDAGESEAPMMRAALSHIDSVMGRVSGDTLVDHFYEDALAGLSERMRALARELGFWQA